MSKPLCIIPARGGSKRFPRKNIALFNGKPLLAQAVETAIASDVFSEVIVTSDDDEFLAVASEYGATAIKRSADLSSDTAQVKQVCADLLKSLADEGKVFDAFAVLIPVSPLRTVEDIQKAYELLQGDTVHTVMSVVPYDSPPQLAQSIKGDYMEPYFDGDKLPAQQMETLYHHDGTVIFCDAASFLEEGEFYGSHVVPYIMPLERTVDIDEPKDLQWAEFLHSQL
jgi:pseudaminic acid cytidylyltransferase